MNKDYVISNNQVFVSDEKGLYKRETNSNIDDILKLENLLELLENALKEKKASYETTKSQSDNRKIKGIAKSEASYLVLIPIITLLGYFLGDASQLVSTALGTLNGSAFSAILFSIFSSIIVIPITAFNVLEEVIAFRKNRRENEGLEEEISFLENYYQTNKAKLEELKQKSIEQTVTAKEDEIISLDSFNKQTESTIEDKTSKLYQLGYYRRRLMSYYKKGILKEKLQKMDFKEEETQLGEEIIAKRFSMKQKKKNTIA